jgi:hypothetical protein
VATCAAADLQSESQLETQETRITTTLPTIPFLPPAQGGAGQTSTFDLEFGGEGGGTFLLWASLSTYPGLSLPPPDVRGIATNPDSLFFASIGANNPLFIGWAGVLSPTGTAIAQLALPNIPLPPLTFHLQAMTVSFRSPTGVRSLSNVHPLRL